MIQFHFSAYLNRLVTIHSHGTFVADFIFKLNDVSDFKIHKILDLYLRIPELYGNRQQCLIKISG